VNEWDERMNSLLGENLVFEMRASQRHQDLLNLSNYCVSVTSNATDLLLSNLAPTLSGMERRAEMG